MPCANHDPKSDPACVSCFTADAIALLGRLSSDKAKWESLQAARNALDESYKGLTKSSEDERENCRSIVLELNRRLPLQKLALIGAQGAIQPWQIQDEHRARYRARLRAMGTWIGFTELHRLATAFSIRVTIAFPSGAYWRCLSVGDAQGTVVASPVLLWSGAHFEVATLTPHINHQFNLNVVTATNPLGDCAFESFLRLVVQANVNLLVGPHQAAKAPIVNQFQLALQRPLRAGLIAADDADYVGAITALRDLLATPAVFSDALVDEAIIADGVLPADDEDEGEDEAPPPKTGLVVSGAAPSLKEFIKAMDGKLETQLKAHATTSRDASNVIGYVQGRLVASSKHGGHGFELSGCGCGDECEHSVSSGDGEVELLNGLLAQALRETGSRVEVILCGPYGACDGCKERIVRFVTLWQAASPASRTLLVHYLYAEVFKQVRGKKRIPTTYGDDRDESLKISQKGALRMHTWGPVTGQK